MSSRAARLARGWVVGVLATATAALSHALAGGGTPSPLALVAGVVFGGMLGTFALSARPSLPRLLIAVGVAQLAFHLAFSTLGTAAVTASDHVHDAAALVVAAAPEHAHASGPLMWFGHAAAAVLTLAFLRGAERAAWQLLTELARLVVSSFRTRVPAPAPVRRTVAPLGSTRPARAASRILISAASRRGPPLSVEF